MSQATCSRSGGAVLCAVKRLVAECRGGPLREALLISQIEFDLIAKKVEPPRAHFMARMEYHRMRLA